MKPIFISLFILIIAFSCTQTPQSTASGDNQTVVRIDTLPGGFDIPLKSPIDSFNFFLQYQLFDDAETHHRLLATYVDSFIRIVDLTTKQEIKQIPIPKNSGWLEDFYIHSFDSIFVFYHYNCAIDKVVDSAFFFMIDSSGTVKKAYSFPSQYIVKRKNSSQLPNDSLVVPVSLATHVGLKNHKFFFLLRPCRNYPPGSDSFLLAHRPLVGYYDIQKDTFVCSHSIWYPNLDGKHFYPSAPQAFYMGVSSHNLPFIKFAFSNMAYEWDYHTDTYRAYAIHSHVFDTVPLLSSPKADLSANQPGNYGVSTYDTLTHRYFTYFFLNDNLVGDFKHILIFHDSSFHYIGETLQSFRIGANRTLNDRSIVIRKHGEKYHIQWLRYQEINGNQQEVIQAIRDSIEVLKKRHQAEMKKSANN